MLGGYKKLREIAGMSGKCRIFAAVKAAIKREKTRKDFEVFRAEAVSNEVQTLNNENYGSKETAIHLEAWNIYRFYPSLP